MIDAAGSLNLMSLIVPDVHVLVLPPSVSQVTGVPTSVVGIVGTASWGPKNAPAPVGPPSDYGLLFGPLKNRKFDMGTGLALAAQQGPNQAYRCVRVTDGTDAAATIGITLASVLQMTFTSKYTGSLANGDKVSVGPGSKASSYKVTVERAGRVPESFDNIGAGLTGNAVWLAIAAAINNGIDGQRGPSELIVATAGAGTATPATAAYTLAGGTDGAGVAVSDLIGADTSGARTGMYALRGSGASIAFLADVDDSTTFATQRDFGLAEGIYFQAITPAGSPIANGTTGSVDLKATAAIDSTAIKIIHGDYGYWPDPVNKVTRLVSTQGVFAGVLANLSPENDGLNKPVAGIIGTQMSYAKRIYSQAELTVLGQAGIDVICNPIPRGAVFGIRFGRNSSSDKSVYNDTYTRMTNFLAATFNAAMGRFVGLNNTPTLRERVKATFDDFGSRLVFNGMIDSNENRLDGPEKPGTNNPQNQIDAGNLRVDVKVKYLSVVENFIVALEGGQTVTVKSISTQGAGQGLAA